MGAEPQKVNKIEIHYSNTAEEMVVKMLEWSIWSLLTVLQGRRCRGKPQWNLERRGPGRGDCWEDAQRDHKGPAEEPASGLSLSSTSSQWKEPNIGRGRGSFWCSCGARGLSSLGRSQQQGAHHFFSDEGISTPGLHSGCHNAVACSKAVANYQSAHLPVSLPFSPGNQHPNALSLVQVFFPVMTTEEEEGDKDTVFDYENLYPFFVSMYSFSLLN